MESQTEVVQEALNQPQQSLAITLSMPQADSLGEGRKRTANELDNENDGDPTKRPKIIPEEDVVVVLCESNNSDPGDVAVVVEGDRISSPFMGGVKLAINLNVKGARFQWEQCPDLPVGVYNAQAVLLERKVYFGGGMQRKETSPPYMYTYDIDDNLWQLLPSPTKRAALAVYHGKVVLAGGITTDGTFTNKVWVLQDDNTWNESLPPIPTARYGASSLADENFLLVAAGVAAPHSHTSDVVEIYDGIQWNATSPLPIKCWNLRSTYLNGYCFLIGGEGQGKSVLYTSIQSLINNATKEQSGWKKLPDVPYSASCTTTFAGTLLAVGGRKIVDGYKEKTSDIFMYFPLTQHWLPMTTMPVCMDCTCAVSLSPHELMVIGGHGSDAGTEYLAQVYKGTLINE